MSFTLLDAHRAIEPILGPPLNRAGVEKLVSVFEELDDAGRVLLFTALALAADHQTSTLAAVQASREETGPLLPARDDHQPDDDLRRWFNAGWPVRRSLVSHRQPRARKDGAA